MAKQNVLDMLKKPLPQKREETPVKEERSVLTEKALALIVKQAKEEMQPLIDVAAFSSDGSGAATAVGLATGGEAPRPEMPSEGLTPLRFSNSHTGG